MPDAAEYATRMINALALTEPELDTSIGSTTRKILDAVAEIAAEASADSHLLDYQFDVNSKVGADLDDFVLMFGLTRFMAQRAVGTVTFSRPTAAPEDISIPSNTQMVSNSSPQILFYTVAPAYLLHGTTSVDVPVQAVVGGDSGNLTAGSITLMATPVDGVASITNTSSTTGGTNDEPDSALIDRFKKTVFRSMAGTECQPPGTMVLVPRSTRNIAGVPGAKKVELGYVPIESLRPGDRVCSWRQGYVIKEGREVVGITSRDYSGRMIVVRTTDGRTSRYTPNHKCLVRMGPALDGKFIVYMQRRGTSFRIGTTTGGKVGSNKKTGSSGIASRMGQQDADEAWILSVHDTKEEALGEEALTSWRFGIPMALFVGDSSSRIYKPQPRLDKFWDEVGDLTQQATQCLDSFGRSIEFSLVQRSHRDRIWNRAGVVHACNLIDGCEVIDTEAMRATGEPFPLIRYASVQVNHEWYDGPVWSMDVAGEHTYIADGFATHNSMYLGVALESSDMSSPERPTHAIVLGSSSRWRERIQVAGDSTATSAMPSTNAKYIFANSSVFGSDIDSGAILTPGIHYTFDDTVIPPKITGLGSALVVGDMYDLDFEYSPTSSRNDPANGITNRIDIWCNGLAPTTATESVYFRSTTAFNSTAFDTMNVARFVRQNTAGTHPTSTNIFVRLAFGPILDFPNSLTVGGTTYYKGTDYWVVHDDTAFGYGPTSLFGLEWLHTHVPTEDSPISLSGAAAYTFNSVPKDVEERVRLWRLVATDVRAHAAKRVNLLLNVAIMFTRGFNPTQVQSDISVAVTAMLAAVGFDVSIQVSDLLQTIHNVQGVDNIRFLTSAEPITGAHYAIERVSDTGAHISYVTTGSPARAADLNLGDNEIPVLYDINVVPKASNTFGVL